MPDSTPKSPICPHCDATLRIYRRVASAAEDVAVRAWGTSCSENEHYERITAMDRLRDELRRLAVAKAALAEAPCSHCSEYQDGTDLTCSWCGRSIKGKIGDGNFYVPDRRPTDVR